MAKTILKSKFRIIRYLEANNKFGNFRNANAAFSFIEKWLKMGEVSKHTISALVKRLTRSKLGSGFNELNYGCRRGKGQRIRNLTVRQIMTDLKSLCLVCVFSSWEYYWLTFQIEDSFRVDKRHEWFFGGLFSVNWIFEFVSHPWTIRKTLSLEKQVFCILPWVKFSPTVLSLLWEKMNISYKITVISQFELYFYFKAINCFFGVRFTVGST